MVNLQKYAHTYDKPILSLFPLLCKLKSIVTDIFKNNSNSIVYTDILHESLTVNITITCEKSKFVSYF